MENKLDTVLSTILLFSRAFGMERELIGLVLSAWGGSTRNRR